MTTALRSRLPVIGSDGEYVGTVKEVRDGDFLVDRPLDRDVYVPLSAVKEILEGRVVVSVPAYYEVGD